MAICSIVRKIAHIGMLGDLHAVDKHKDKVVVSTRSSS